MNPVFSFYFDPYEVWQDENVFGFEWTDRHRTLVIFFCMDIQQNRYR